MKGVLIFIGTIFLLCGCLGGAEAVGFTVTGLPNLSNYNNTYVPGNIVLDEVSNPPTITASPATGTIFSCYGTSSTSPNIEQFTVSGTDLTSDITANAPAGFEISLLPSSGYGSTVTLIQSGGTVNSVTVYVRSASSAAAGSLSGNVMLTSTSAVVQSVAVSATINAILTVNAVSNLTVYNGDPVTPINFTGTGNTFIWTNDMPGIGLAASGTGDIASFTAVNSTTSPIVATVTVTPVPTSFAYITNNADNTVSVINTTTNEVVSTITIPNVPVGQVALPPAPVGVSASPDGSRVYVANNYGSVSVLNTGTNIVIANITIPDSTLNGQFLFPSPNGIVVSPDGLRVYVVNYNQQSLSIINTLTNTIAATLSLEPAGFALGGVAVSPDGETVYVANSDYSSVSVFSMVTYKIVATIAVGGQPVGIALSPDGSKLYVASQKQLWVISTATNSVLSTISTGVDIGNRGVAVSPDGSRVYVTNIVDNTVAVINTATNAVITTIPVGNTPYGITVTPDGSEVFISNNGSNTVSVISTATNAVTGTINVGNSPYAFGNFISAATQCTSPIKFTITVNPSLPTITATGTPSALTTTYGTPSASTNFTVSRTNLTAGILITPPTGFEASTDNINFSPTVTVGGAGTVASTNVYLKLSSTDAVGNYSGNILLTSTGAVSINMPTANSTVTPAPLTVTANDTHKTYGAVLTGSTASTAFTVTGLQNSETIGSVTIAYGTGSAAGDAPKTYTGSVVPTAATGGTFTASNYNITYVPGNIIVDAVITPPAITASMATGVISACYGTASASPNSQQFTLSGNNLTGDITVTAPAGFEISLAAGSGYAGNVVVSQSGGIVNNTVVYARSAASAGAGNISGNVVLSSAGAATQNVAVTGTVNALPTVNTVTDQTVTNGGSTAAVQFTPTIGTFTWTNDTPGIGLAASGSGDIASFAAVNTSSSPVKATITVKPIRSALAYVANADSDNVKVINISQNKVVAIIPVGKYPIGVAVSPDGSRVYISNSYSNTISVINSSTNAVVATVPVGSGPLGLCLNPDGNKLYVANFSGGSLSVVNTVTNQVVATGQIDGNPIAIATNLDGSAIFVTNTQNRIDLISAVTDTIISDISYLPSTSPASIALSKDGAYLYVGDPSGKDLVFIDIASKKIISDILVGFAPLSICLSQDGATLYVANYNSNSVSIINTSNRTVIATVDVGTQPRGLSISPDGKVVYVINSGSKFISVLDVSTNTIVSTIPVALNSQSSYGNFMSPGSGCDGLPVTFTITVKPTAINSSITTTSPTGTITACAGTASISPNIQQFTVSGTGLTADIIATAPNNFEISLSPGSGYGNTLTLTQLGGVVKNATIYVRSSSLAPTGSITGNVSLASTGLADQKVPVAGTINALPTVNAVASQTVANGSTTNAVVFAGTGASYTWTNNTPTIGLAASGTGAIPAFTAVNNTANNITATITATPSSSVLAYITNQTGAGTVSVIDITTNAVVATIQVGANPYGVSVSPDGSKAYVTNTSSNSVSVIDTKTNTVTATIPVGESPGGVTVSTDGSKVFVACISTANTATIWVINTSDNSISQLSATNGTGFVAVSPDGKRIYVTAPNLNQVLVVDTQANTIVATVAVGSNPQAITISPDGKWVYAANFVGNSVSVINTVTNTVAATIATGGGPLGLAVSADGSQVYVANYYSNSISVINTATYAITSTISGLVSPEGTSLSADGSHLYVANQRAGNVAVIDLATNTITTTIAVGSQPGAMGNFIGGGNGCTGTPVSFTITVTPPQNPLIATTGNPAAVTTAYGTPSAATSFSVSGSNTNSGVLITPPTGFEVSTDNINFTSTVTVGTAGTIAATTVYIRLKQTANAGSYTGNIVLTSSGATNVIAPIPTSTVTPAPLIITANNAHNTYGSKLTGSGSGSKAFTVTGLQNSETIGNITTTYGSGSAATDPAGTYKGSATASAATGGNFNPANYNITYIPGDVIVAPATLTIIADDKTKIYNDPNPVLTAGYIGFVNTDSPAQLTTAPVISTTATINSPVGQYPITVGGAASSNYTISYLPGVLTIELTPITLVIPNTFTPNNDGINDTWTIKNIEFFPKCTVDIFTRWGQKVYSSIGYPAAWNGLYNNSKLPNGTYYYVIDLKNGSKLSSGFVAIVR